MNESLITKKLSLAANDTSLQYTEKPDELKALMGQIEIRTEYAGTDFFFDSDKEKRVILRVYVKRGNKEITFRFGMSINDTVYLNNDYTAIAKLKRIKKVIDIGDYAMQKDAQKQRLKITSDLLYSILTCIHSEYYCPDNFDNFCAEFGYDTDSRKAEKSFEALKEQSRQLQRIFSESEIECLPS